MTKFEDDSDKRRAVYQDTIHEKKADFEWFLLKHSDSIVEYFESEEFQKNQKLDLETVGGKLTLPDGFFSALRAYLTITPDCSVEIQGIIKKITPKLTRFLFGSEEEISTEIFNLTYLLISAHLLPEEVGIRFQEEINKNEAVIFSNLLRKLNALLSIITNYFLDSSDNEALIDLLFFVDWTINSIFKTLPRDTEIRMSAHANFSIWLKGFHQLCNSRFQATKNPEIESSLGNVEDYFVEGSRYVATTIEYALDPSKQNIIHPQEFDETRLFSIASYIDWMKFEMSDGDFAQTFVEVEEYLQSFLSQVDIFDPEILPFCSELFFQCGKKIQKILIDQFLQQLSPIEFSRDDISYLLTTWFRSHDWYLEYRIPWEPASKRAKKISNEITQILALEADYPGAPSLLFHKFGIVHFTRYPFEMLASQAKREMAIRDGDILSTGRPTAAIVTAILDHNFAFDSLNWQLPDLDKKTNKVFDFYIFEFENKSNLKQQLSEFRHQRGRCGLLLLSGHGTELWVELGKDKTGRALLITLQDVFLGVTKNSKRFFRSGATLILNSCSTAKPRDFAQQIENTGELVESNATLNIATGLADSFGVRVVGPDRPCGINTFNVQTWSRNLPRVSVTYIEKNKNTFPGTTIYPAAR